MSERNRHASELRSSLRGHTLLTSLVAHGYLSPGDQLVYHQPRLHKAYRCRITDDHALLVEHLGVPFRSPSTAARASAGGKGRNGLTDWCKVSDGTSLWDLREQLILKLVAEH